MDQISSGFAGALVLIGVLATACSSTPSTEPTPVPSRSTPQLAAQLIRSTVTGARPLLIPNTLAPDWTADATVNTSSFSVVYRSPDGKKVVTLAIAAANPSLPGQTTAQFNPSFHGDARSLYQIADTSAPRSDRILVWAEKGTWVVSGRAEVPYVLSSKGLTHEEFWEIANGLHPNQI